MREHDSAAPADETAAREAAAALAGLMKGTGASIKAELRTRDDGLYGVIWVEDADGTPVGDMQLETGPMPDCLGSRVAWNLQMKTFAEYTGAHLTTGEDELLPPASTGGAK